MHKCRWGRKRKCEKHADRKENETGEEEGKTDELVQRKERQLERKRNRQKSERQV